MDKTEFLHRLMEEAYPMLLRYAMSVFHDRMLAEELALDTFHEAARHLDVLLCHDNPTGWLVVVLKNKMKTYNRQQKRHAEHQAPWSEVLAARLPNPSELPLGGEAHLLLLSLPKLLPPEDYRFFKAFLDGATYTELAERCGMTVWSCRKRIQRIRDRLRSEFRKN